MGVTVPPALLLRADRLIEQRLLLTRLGPWPTRSIEYLLRKIRMSGTRYGLVIKIALLLSGPVAMAQRAGDPCASDIKTICAGIQPGGGRIKGCIESHWTDLSPTCQDHLLTVAVTAKVCTSDVANLCSGIVRGSGGIRSCIKSHISEVSDSCRDAMSRAAAGRQFFVGRDL